MKIAIATSVEAVAHKDNYLLFEALQQRLALPANSVPPPSPSSSSPIPVVTGPVPASPILQGINPSINAARTIVSIVVWDDPKVDWSSFDLVVVRSVWNYHKHKEAFLKWARIVSQVAHLVNQVDIMEWNMDRSVYLRELELRGVPVVSTLAISLTPNSRGLQVEVLTHATSRPSSPSACAPELIPSPKDLNGLLRDRGWREVLVRPAIASHQASAQVEPVNNVAELVANTLASVARWGIAKVLVQPMLRCLTRADQGELSFIFFNGLFCHCMRRVLQVVSQGQQPPSPPKPKKNQQPQQQPVIEPTSPVAATANSPVMADVWTSVLPSDDELFFAINALKTCSTILRDKLLVNGGVDIPATFTFARVDVLRTDDNSRLVLGGIEAIDPSLFLDKSKTAANIFADALLAHLRPSTPQQIVQTPPMLPMMPPLSFTDNRLSPELFSSSYSGSSSFSYGSSPPQRSLLSQSFSQSFSTSL